MKDYFLKTDPNLERMIARYKKPEPKPEPKPSLVQKLLVLTPAKRLRNYRRHTRSRAHFF